ncbi:MAG: hypothetical protein ABW024_04315 [Microbacterium sp.]
MKETTMREAIEEIVRAVSATWTHDRTPRAPRVPRSMRPHRARSTFLLPTEVEVSRRVAA